MKRWLGTVVLLIAVAGCRRASSDTARSQHFVVRYTVPHRTDDARLVLGILEEAAAEMKNELGYGPLSPRVQVILYSSSPEFSSATGKPWWLGAVYDGRIHLQPLATLKRRGILRTSLRHEYAHLIFHTFIRASTPLWFEEGFAEFFAEGDADPGAMRKSNAVPGEWLEKVSQLDRSREETEKFYHAAAERVRGIVEARGFAGLREILSALAAGIPFERAWRERAN